MLINVDQVRPELRDMQSTELIDQIHSKHFDKRKIIFQRYEKLTKALISLFRLCDKRNSFKKNKAKNKMKNRRSQLFLARLLWLGTF